MAAPQQIPLTISVAPFPEGFEGDMDEHAQQLVALMEAFIEGNFLTGLILPPGSTLPTSDQGPIAMGGVWYFWDPTTGQYLPQTVSSKIAKNFVKNCVYQVQQTGSAFTVGAGITKTYDMVLTRSTLGSVLAISADVGPAASVDNDYCPAAIKYTVGPTLVPTPGVTDLYVHEHLIEGADIAMIQAETLSLSFSVWVNQPGTYSYYLTSSGRDCSYVGNFTIATANAWTRIKVLGIPAFPTTVGTWNFSEGATGLYFGVPMCVGTQWQSAAGNLNKWQPAFMAGSAANSNLLTVINNQIKISGVKLEASPQVSYLSVPAFADDLDLLSRYYFTSFLYQSSTQGTPIAFIAHQAGGWACSYIFPRRMAQAPTVIPFSFDTHAAGLITDMSTSSPFDIPVASLPATKRGIAGTGVVSSINTTGTLNSTTTITAIPSTAGISTGALVSGAGIPSGTIVTAIPSGSSITLSQAATATATNVALGFTNSTNFTTTGTTNSSSTTGTTTTASLTVTAVASTAGMQAGMPVSGTGLPPGTVITAVLSGTSFTISIPASFGVAGGTLTFGLNSITAIPSTSGMGVGMPISGNGIPAGSTITAIVSASSLTISNFLTAYGTGVAITVTTAPVPPAKGDLFWALITADARLS
jgi:hypothetical protein